jgi:serine phosphatase RsbU (regulator of sigma subunit)
MYGYLLHGDDLYFCIGDVSGKGIPASLFMTQATRLFHALATQHLTPALIATEMNAELTEGNETGMFITMFIGLVNLDTGHLSFCNAGHTPPLLDNKFLEVESNAPIGLWPELNFVGEEIDNIKGSLFFTYTDGLNEAEDIHQVQFGDKRIQHILSESHLDNARQTISRLKKEVDNHRCGAEPNDDITMLCLRIN